MVRTRSFTLTALAFLSTFAGMVASDGQAGPTSSASPSTAQAEPITRGRWKISFQLTVNRAAPEIRALAARLPHTYEAESNLTRYVLERIARAIITETKAQQRGLYFGPGGYKKYPLAPSAQLDVDASREEVVTLEESIGYLARQNEVIASRVADSGDKPAYQIVQTAGQSLLKPEFLQRFWNRLGALSPTLQQGFLPLRVNQQPGIRIINTETAWSDADYADFDHVTDALAQEFRLPLKATRMRVYFDSVVNTWRDHPDGSDYLNDLRKRGQAALADRLVTKYQPLVTQWIVAGLKRYGEATPETNQ